MKVKQKREEKKEKPCAKHEEKTKRRLKRVHVEVAVEGPAPVPDQKSKERRSGKIVEVHVEGALMSKFLACFASLFYVF